MFINFFAEYFDAFDKINICLTFQKPIRGLGISLTKPNLLQLTYSCIETKEPPSTPKYLAEIALLDLELLPTTCSNLKFDTLQNTLEISLKAFKKKSDSQKDKHAPVKYIQEILKQSFQLKCYICKGGILNTRSINQVLDLPPLNLLGSHSDDLFCHAPKKDENNSSQWRPPPPTTVLTNGRDFMTNSLLHIKPNIKQGIHDLVCCSRCLNILGRKILINDENVYCFNTSRLLAEVEEKDIDGDFLQNIDVPMIEKRSAYFSFWIQELIEEHSFRVIVSSCTSESSQEFMLLWLFDKTSCIYSSSVDLDVNSLIDACESGQTVQTDSSNLSPQSCHSLLYQICEDENNKVLNDWKHDLSVHHVDLPEDECQELARLLIQSTQRLPKLQRLVNAFYRGEIPVA